MSTDTEIVKEFVDESKVLIAQMTQLLEEIEDDYSQVKRLGEYGNCVDRIMGGAQSLALLVSEDHALHVISDYASLCKAVSYKASQIDDNENLYFIAVGLLLDGTETLDLLVDKIHETQASLKQSIPEAFIERLRWISDQFSNEHNASVGADSVMSQSEIDDLMKKLGL